MKYEVREQSTADLLILLLEKTQIPHKVQKYITQKNHGSFSENIVVTVIEVLK